MSNISVDGYLTAQGFNKYQVPEGSSDGTLWVRELDGVKLQVFMSNHKPDSFLVEMSVNKPFYTNGLFSEHRLHGEFTAGPLSAETIVNNGIILSLQKSVDNLIG
jgi:nitrogenase molybdenum-iron protein alpha/beta subunit